MRVRTQLRNSILATLVLATVCIIFGCGTAHHFLPSRPIEKGKWELNVAWHLDFDELGGSCQSLFPAFNVYYGISDRTIIGFGTIPSLYPPLDHVTVAHYTMQHDNTYILAWSHLKAVSGTDNPRLEIGSSYSWGDSSLTSMISMGIGLGAYRQWNLCKLENRRTFLGGYMPIVKYSVRGRDFGIENTHYFQKVFQKIKQSFPHWPPTEDTVLVIRGDEVASTVILVHDSAEQSHRHLSSGRSLMRGDSIIVTEKRVMLICGGAGIPYFIMDQLDGLKWSSSKYPQVEVNGTWAIVDFDEIQKSYDRGESIIITRAPEAFVERVEELNHWFVDNSIGWAIFPKMYPK